MKFYCVFYSILFVLLVSCKQEKQEEKQTVKAVQQIKTEDTGNNKSIDREDSSVRNLKCTYLNKFSLAQRLSSYPFNKALKVKLVAFKDKNTDEHVGAGRLVENDKVAYSRIFFEYIT